MTADELKEKLRVMSLAISDARGCSKHESTTGAGIKWEGVELGLRQAMSILLSKNPEKWYEQNGIGHFSEESTVCHEQNVARRKKRWQVGDVGWIRHAVNGIPIQVRIVEADSNYLVVLVGLGLTGDNYRRQVRRSEIHEHEEEAR